MARDATPQADTKRVTVALAVATAVTLAAAVPLGAIAWAARDTAPAAADGLVIEVAGEVRALSGYILAAGADAELQIDDPEFVAAAWSLYEGDDLLAGAEVIGEPPYILELTGADLASLTRGTYDLLVTGTQRDGTVVERAATFAVGDGQ